MAGGLQRQASAACRKRRAAGLRSHASQKQSPRPGRPWAAFPRTHPASWHRPLMPGQQTLPDRPPRVVVGCLQDGDEPFWSPTVQLADLLLGLGGRRSLDLIQGVLDPVRGHKDGWKGIEGGWDRSAAVVAGSRPVTHPPSRWRPAGTTLTEAPAVKNGDGCERSTRSGGLR